MMGGERDEAAHVAMLIPHIGMGGDWVVVRSLAGELTSAGSAEVSINGLDAAEALAKRPPNPMPFTQGLGGWGRAWANRRRIPRAADVLHAHSPGTLLFAWLLRLVRCRRARLVLTYHFPVEDGGWRRRVKGWILRRANACHAPSAYVRRVLTERYGVRPDRVRVLPLGLSASRFVPREAVWKRERRDRLGLLPDARVVGFMGRLATEKNVSYLIRFADRWHGRFPGLVFLIAGTGDLGARLHEEAARGPAEDRIRFLGHTAEPWEVLPVFDLHVLPSSFEAFALTVVEAAFCGVPTLRSNTGGSEEQIVDGESGFLFDIAGGYEAFERRLTEILKEDWTRLPVVGEAARRRCTALCDMQSYRRGVRRLYGFA